jgi:alkanesulfonate monooxygenase
MIMQHEAPTGALEVYSTCPPSSLFDGDDYPAAVIATARASEEHGCTGILVYTDNSLLDPWYLAQIIIQHTRSLTPLIAVQPVYMHPYWVAKKITTLAYLYGRRVALNMVAGGFATDLAALKDLTPHDRRYDRAVEYTTIIKRLLGDVAPLSYRGEFYTVDKLRLAPSLPPHLFPPIFISGSSAAGCAAARALGAVAIEYPKPANDYIGRPADETAGIERGIRIGVIARDTEGEAWRTARQRFPEDRKGQITHQLAMKVSDSAWHRQLSQLAEESEPEIDAYWLVPFQNYKTFCPYLVGRYDRVGDELARYLRAGFRTFILDVPPSEDDLRHTHVAFTTAAQQVAA